MKLIVAIVNHDDANAVARALTKGGFSSTKLATTGGFLMMGNATLLIGVDEARVQAAIDLIKENATGRRQVTPAALDPELNQYAGASMEVTVGGATIFVVDIERFERV